MSCIYTSASIAYFHPSTSLSPSALQDVAPPTQAYTFPSLKNAKYHLDHSCFSTSLTNIGVSTATFDQSTIPNSSAMLIHSLRPSS